MIHGRKLVEDIIRPHQDYDTRLDKIRLGMNERYPSMPEELFNEIISGYTIEEASSYPEMKLVYESLSKYINQPTGRILFASGADMAIKMVLESLCESGSKLLTCYPTYVMYKVYAKMLNCSLRGIQPNENGDYKIQDLIEQAKKDTDVVILANPNGVSGFYFTLDEIRLLLSELPGMPVILDEAYADFADLDASGLLEEFDNLIIIRSFSKNIGFTGLQIGYVLAQEQLIEFIEKFKPTIELNSLAARAIKVMCSKPGLLKRLVKDTICTRNFFASELKKLGFKVIEKGGNFILVNFGSKSEDIKKKLEDNDIEFKTVSAPFDGYIRLAIANKKVMNFVLKVISDI